MRNTFIFNNSFTGTSVPLSSAVSYWTCIKWRCSHISWALVRTNLNEQHWKPWRDLHLRGQMPRSNHVIMTAQWHNVSSINIPLYVRTSIRDTKEHKYTHTVRSIKVLNKYLSFSRIWFSHMAPDDAGGQLAKTCYLSVCINSCLLLLVIV